MTQRLTLQQEGPINTLALNKECNKVVVTGRNIFRVCEIKETGFVERDNIRTGKNSNLNFSCNDASWNPVDEQWLATAATNGAVVLWNIHRSIKLKQEMVYYDHKRTVNKVTFHGTEPHLLLSGSQDGTMKCFDIRMKVASTTFVSNAESVRDVQFNPHQCFQFAAVSENGTVQLWDLRRADRCDKQFTAHSGPVFACDWHPEVKTWLATAGRDRAVKVWDIGFRPVLEYTVTTMAAVGRIRWRPQKTHHIASAALVVDSSIHVWDVRRPFIPHASFNDHKDITTGIAWRNSPDLLLSTSKDSFLIQHVYSDAERLQEKANPVCVTYDSRGSLTFASAENRFAPMQRNSSARKSSKSESSAVGSAVTTSSSIEDPYPAVRCSIYVFENAAPTPTRVFEVCAHGYQVTTLGRTLTEVCEHNAMVAQQAGKGTQAVTVWQMVGLIMEKDRVKPPQSSNIVESADISSSALLGDVHGAKDSAGSSRPGTRHQSGSNQEVSGPSSTGVQGSLPTSNERGVSDTSGGVSEEAESEVEDLDIQERTLSHIASGSHFNTSDFLFGDNEADLMNDFHINGGPSVGVGDRSAESGRSANGTGGDTVDTMVGVGGSALEWILPSEAFQPRHEIKDRTPPPEHYTSRCFETSRFDTQMVQVEDSTSALLCLPGTSHSVSPWNGTSSVVEMLYHLAENGDVQTAVTLVLVLGDRVRHLINEAVLEQWFLAYVDALSRCRLWNTAAIVTKLSPCEKVQGLSHRSTVYFTHCNMCHRALQRSGWLCDSCKSITNTCSLCHLVVRGLYVWCRGCSHGGHLLHIGEWFAKNAHCPTGCGHICEYD